MPRPTLLPLTLQDDGRTPVFLQIARAIAQDIERGRLRASDRLPGSRALAASLGVHRNTVLAALDELVAQGFIYTSPARGVFVSPAWANAQPLVTGNLQPRPHPGPRPSPSPSRSPSPAPSPSRSPSPAPPALRARAAARPHRALILPPPPALYPPLPAMPAGSVVFQSGVPDVRLLPVTELARAYRRTLRRSVAGGPGRSLLGYGDAHGHPALRAALARMMAERRGLLPDPERVLVTRGSQMGLDLCARLLVRPGDRVAVEAIGYPPAWNAFVAAGAVLVPVPVDGDGMNVAALAELTQKTTLRAVYVTPHHQYPTSKVLSGPRRKALLGLCATRGIAILEDDYDHEFHYEGQPVLPLASQDDAGVVLYLGTLSKVLAPGLRCGFVHAAPGVIVRLAQIRRHVDRQGDLPLEATLAELIEDGVVARHVRRMRTAYLARRDVLVAALHANLDSELLFSVPSGGLGLWARVAINVKAWVKAAAARGVGITPGAALTVDRRAIPFVRLGFGALNETEIKRGVGLLAAAAADVRTATGA